MSIAEEYLIDSREQTVRRNGMKSVCLSCHATSWTEKFISGIDSTNMLADQMVLSATKILQTVWDAGINDPAHDLRDSFVSHLIYLDYSLEDVSKIAGHSSIKVTERHYYEQLQERRRSMLSDLENYVAKSQSTSKTDAVSKKCKENG